MLYLSVGKKTYALHRCRLVACDNSRFINHSSGNAEVAPSSFHHSLCFLVVFPNVHSLIIGVTSMRPVVSAANQGGMGSAPSSVAEPSVEKVEKDETLGVSGSSSKRLLRPHPHPFKALFSVAGNLSPRPTMSPVNQYGNTLNYQSLFIY